MPASLADRLNQLFDVMHAAHQPAATNNAVAQSVAAQSRTAFTGEDLRQIRAGSKGATEQQLEAIAQWFGVPASFLMDSNGNADVDTQLGLLKAMRDQGVRAVGCAGRLAHAPGDANAISALAAIVARLGTEHST